MSSETTAVPAISSAPIAGLLRETDDQFQARMLRDVSRTFALTIPQLPQYLREVVGNGYLLCRIVDTIEDDASLTVAQKHEYCALFTEVVNGRAVASAFAHDLASLLAPTVPAAERELINETARVIAIMGSFRPVQQQALQTCVTTMAAGMAEFQARKTTGGLPVLYDMDRYCYYVAGVVGEMLTRLFCDYSPAIAQHRESLMTLAVSFGQALQMTNILKDIWEDRARGACWLPRDIFVAEGFDLDTLVAGQSDERFGRGLGQLIAIAHGHLHNALRYTLLIPPHETGLRKFCLWALGMAILTLRKIDRHRDFATGQQVKISRRSVQATMAISQITVGNDWLLRAVFRAAGSGVPRVAVGTR
ncbi:MAG: phytoene/squalene synthase family protein [Acidiferrobacter sp.]